MYANTLLICLVLATSLGKEGAPSPQRQREPAPSSHATMTFSVGSAATSQHIEGVAVLLLKSQGQLVTLGQTDRAGRLSIHKSSLREDGGVVVLFCKERFFCGAFRLDDPEFFEYDYRLINLAPFAVP